jgi:putative transposase
VVAEAYVLGVSTRKVEDLVETLGIERLSEPGLGDGEGTRRGGEELPRAAVEGPLPVRLTDAIEVKCREEGGIVNVACLVAVGVNNDGRREVLGLEALSSDYGAG